MLCSAMIVIVLVSALVFPLIFLINLEPAARQLIASASIGLVCTISLLIMFVPKLMAVIEENEIDSTKFFCFFYLMIVYYQMLKLLLQIMQV